MSDPYQLWREAEGQSKRKTVEQLWPALAEALGGVTAAPDTETDPQPLCHGCGAASGRLAIGRVAQIPVCGRCIGQDPFRDLKPKTLVKAWPPGRQP